MPDDSRPMTSPAPEPRPQDKPEWAMSRREIERVLRARAGLPPLRRRWPWLILAVLLVAAAAFGVLQYQQRAATTDAVAEPAPEPVIDQTPMQLNAAEFATLQPMRLERRVKVTGTLQPARQTEFSSQAGGRVEEVAVRPGDTVAEGDLLVQVDVEALTIQLDLARSNASANQSQLALAEATLERSEALLQRGVATTSTLDEVRSNVEALRANLSAQQDQVRAADLQLRNATLRAPFDGVVSARNADPGQYVTIGAPLVTVVDLSSVELQGNAPVASGALLHPDQQVEVSVDGIRERRFEGTVVRINPVAAEGTRTIPVYVTIDNTDGTLLGGMFATGEVVVETATDAIAVPTDALREDADGLHVLKIVDGHLARQPVEVAGDWAGRLTQVTSGLGAGDTVVTAPLPELADGDPVELAEG